MRKFNYTAIAAVTLLTASAGFAQTSMGNGTSDMSNQNMNNTQQMNDMNNANAESRAPAAVDARGAAYDSSMPANRATSSGVSGTTGGYATGAGASANQYNNQYGPSPDVMNGSGHYADTARGSQLNANDVHATPQPGALNNQLFRGN